MATTSIFVNLQISDIATTRSFWSALGYTFNEDFCSEQSVSLEIGPGIYAMLLTPDHFTTFTVRPVASGETEAILALGVESREEVDRIADAALAGGGAKAQDPQDHGWMYGRSFLDPDGHHWEVTYMDLSAAG
ncbi:VOC family protein [Pseudonocardia pini]|uniref:VOC family protein n=1 Tax=Pseudonocardia pini TaxID=2758030 RepID=UPI0015F0F194|nr:VOC family protein [Pseudonocardia pini]